MKKLFIFLIGLCTGIAGTVVCLHHQKATPVPAPVVSAPANPLPAEPPEESSAPKPQPLATTTDTNGVATATAPVVSDTPADHATNAISKLVDGLLSAKNGPEKHELFQQLLKSGQMDAAIAELKQRAADNPNNPEIPTTIGEALLNQVAAIKAAGGSNDQMGILAMQADQDFDTALKIDPQNWEANFVKASMMYYWPASLQMDGDVVQRLSGLIDQQDTLPSQPEFAQTYLVLGNEYQKIGQPDKALATWQLGLTKFPNNSALQQKISGAGN
jgi:tetratricopeptide (TPR) repeat protein